MSLLDIPASVQSLGGSVFQDCLGLIAVDIAPSNSAYSSIDGVVFNPDQTSLLYYPPNKSGVQYAIPGSVSTVSDGAVVHAQHLAYIAIPSTVSTIGDRAFERNSNLTDVLFEGNAPVNFGAAPFDFAHPDFTVFYQSTNSGFTTPAWQGYPARPLDVFVYQLINGNTEIEITGYPSGLNGALSIPAYITGLPVTSIGAYAFQDSTNLTSVLLPETITSIGDYAFAGTNQLTSIVLPSSVTSVGDHAFDGNTQLSSAFFQGHAPVFFGAGVFANTDAGFSVSYVEGATGFTTPSWQGYTAQPQFSFTYNEWLFPGEIWITDFPEDATGPVNIPSVIDGKPVTGIGSSAFYRCREITSVTIPDSVVTISTTAFDSCNALASISIPDSVTSIGMEAFDYCGSLTSIDIPNSVTTIGQGAFQNCTGLKSISLPDSLTTLGALAFYRCSALESIILPDSLGAIESACFDGCSALVSVQLPNTLQSIANRAFSVCSSLTNIVIPASVTTIGDTAFQGCSSLQSANIPAAVTSVGVLAFSGCPSLTAIDVHTNNSFYSSDNGVFFDKDQTNLMLYPAAKLTASYTIPSSVTVIDTQAFRNAGYLSQVFIPSSVSEIPAYTFRDSGLQSITIPNSITAIGTGAFYDCASLASVILPDTLSLIEQSLFYNCSSLTSIPIPASVTAIKSYAFYGCSSLPEISIPDSMTTIETYTFYGCSGLTSVTLPGSLNSIGRYAFQGCAGLLSLTIPNTVSLIDLLAFEGCSNLVSVTLPSSLTTLGAGALKNCISLPSITLPGSITTIPAYAFEGCASLASIDIPATVTSIGALAFYGTAFSSIPSASGVTTIQGQTYAYCSNLVDVVIPESITTINNSAFSFSGLASVEIPNSVSTLSGFSFGYCLNLTNISVDVSSTQFSSSEGILFDKAGTSLVCYPAGRAASDYEVPAGITVLKGGAFIKCLALESVVLPAGMITIQENAFSVNSNLKSMLFLGDAPQIRVYIPGGRYSPGRYAYGVVNSHPDFALFYLSGSAGFITPTWQTYPTYPLNSVADYPVALWNRGYGFAYDQDLSADLNGDGISLLTAYALKLDPTKINPDVLNSEVTDTHLLIHFYGATPYVAYEVMASTNLVDWAGTGVVVTGPDTNRTASVQLIEDKQFLKLELTH